MKEGREGRKEERKKGRAACAKENDYDNHGEGWE